MFEKTFCLHSAFIQQKFLLNNIANILLQKRFTLVFCAKFEYNFLMYSASPYLTAVQWLISGKKVNKLGQISIFFPDSLHEIKKRQEPKIRLKMFFFLIFLGAFCKSWVNSLSYKFRFKIDWGTSCPSLVFDYHAKHNNFFSIYWITFTENTPLSSTSECETISSSQTSSY